MPLLTMGLISRELGSGTMTLLYTSPVRIREIVLGKYLGILSYSIVLLGIVSVFMFLGLFHIQTPEFSIMLSGLLGFFFLLATYAAIGLFMSSLTSYQVVAALSTFIVIGLLGYIGGVWQDKPFFREITYFLSISGRTEKMLSGLITTKDIVYFLSIIFMFLALTVLKLKSSTESKPFWLSFLRNMGVIALTVTVGYLASIHSWIGYLDVTSNKRNTLSPKVQQIVQKFGNEPLTVTNYANALDRYFFYGTPQLEKSMQDRWEKYLRFKEDISIRSVMYYDTVPGFSMRVPGKLQPKTIRDKAKKFIKTFDLDINEDLLTPEEIKQQVDLSSENNRFVMKLDWKDRSTFLRVYDDMLVWPSETEVAAALLRLQKAHLPKIAFLTGSLQRDIEQLGDDAYKLLTNLPTYRNSLVNQGFDVESLDLTVSDVPEGVTALVLADPRVAMDSLALNRIKEYISKGGNMFIAAEPVSPTKKDVLAPLLDFIGVQLEPGNLIQASKNYAPDFVEAYMTQGIDFYPPLKKSIKDSLPITMKGVTGLIYNEDNNFEVTDLVRSNDKKTWHTTKAIDWSIKKRAELKLKNPKDSLGILTYDPERGDIRQSFPTVIGLKRMVDGKEQRIVVAGDADFLSNAELRRSNTANFTFSTGLFSWLSSDEFPVMTTRPGSLDKKVLVTSDRLKTQKIIFMWVLPSILLALASIVLIRRKRK